MTTHVLITGSSGVLGRAVYDKLSQESEFVTHGLVYSRNNNKNRVICDLTCEKSTITVLDSIKPLLIIHCAAERRPDVVASNKDKASQLNLGSAEIITKWCEANKCHLIFVSTDYVFDGSAPPYKEDDPVNPLNDYGALKAEAEKVVLGSSSNAIVLRLPVLYGRVEFVEETAVTVLFSMVKDHTRKAPMSNFERRYPTHCDDVSQTILNMVKYWLVENNLLSGVYHYQTDEELTKFDMALKMAAALSLPCDHIVAADPPDGNEVTKRPYKAQMSCEKLITLGLYHEPRPFSLGIAECLLPFAS